MVNDFRKKLSLNIGLALILTAILAIFIIFIGYDINKRIFKIEAFREELKFRTNALNSLASLRQESEKAKPYFNMLQTILPTKDEIVNFLKELNDLAKINKIELGFSFGNEILGTPSEPGATNFNLTVSGNYNNIFNFLRSAEKSRYVIGWESVDLTRDPQSQRFSALISGKVFSK